MKPLLYTFALVGLLSLWSFRNNKPAGFVPPGTNRINDTLFMDKTEVTNFAWREYESWVKQKYGSHSKEHDAVLPDTLVWRKKLAYNEPYVEYYYRHPAYNHYPVVGISYEQAAAYCQWRTERVYEMLCTHKKPANFLISYQLPSISEWEFCSNNASNISWAQHGLDKKGQIQLNCVDVNRKVVNGKDTVFQTADVTTPAQFYAPNAFGLYNMLGNVAEMVSEKGICKGGGWTHRLEDCRPGKNIHYTETQSWLGFRCVCIVKHP